MVGISLVSLFAFSACGANDDVSSRIDEMTAGVEDINPTDFIGTTKDEESEETVVEEPVEEEVVVDEAVVKYLDAYDSWTNDRLKANERMMASRDDENKSIEKFYDAAKEDDVFSDFNVDVSDCVIGCSRLESLDVFEPFYNTQGDAVDIGKETVAGVDVYYVMTSGFVSGDTTSDHRAYFEHNGYFISTKLGEGFSVADGGTLEKGEMKDLQMEFIKSLIEHVEANM